MAKTYIIVDEATGESFECEVVDCVDGERYTHEGYLKEIIEVAMYLGSHVNGLDDPSDLEFIEDEETLYCMFEDAVDTLPPEYFYRIDPETGDFYFLK